MTAVAKLDNGLTPLLSKYLGSQDLAKHRAMVAFELEVLAKKTDRFGWERDRGTPAHDRLISDWMDVLQDYPLDEVKTACGAALKAKSGKMPNEYEVVTQIEKARKARLDAMPKRTHPEPEKELATSHERQAILKEHGFHTHIKRFGA